MVRRRAQRGGPARQYNAAIVQLALKHVVLAGEGRAVEREGAESAMKEAMG